MKKYLKKFGAFLMAAIMMLAMCSISTFADDNTPKASDQATITVKDVEAGATVTAYQIVEAEYNAFGFVKYNSVEANGAALVADAVNPTSEEVQSIAAQISTGAITLASHELTQGADGSYTALAEAGYWVVLVKGGDASKVYNPMLAGVYYSKGGSDNTLTNEAVSANDKWDLKGTEAYDKSVSVSVDKNVTGSTRVNADGTTTEADTASENGDDVAIGDYVHYSVDGTIPAYTDAYTYVAYKLTDTTSAGLDLLKNDGHAITVKVGNAAIAEGADTYTATVSDDKHTLTIEFNSAFILAHAGQALAVTYDAQLNENAATNLDANTNTVKATYTNDPTVTYTTDPDTGELVPETPTTDTPDSVTYHYTFELDGNLSQDTTIENWKTTTELTKLGEKNSTDKESGETINGPLAGATFTLTNNATGVVYTATSDANGHLNFKGLDAGTYKLQETVAPEGYTINKNIIPVEITAIYNEDGTLNSYAVTVNNEATSTYTAVYSQTVTGKVTSVTIDSTDFNIPNTKISSLPSTGGMGTYLFTIAGIAVMAVAVGMLAMSKRKKNN